MSENFDFDSLDDEGWAKLEEAHEKVNGQVKQRTAAKIEKTRAEVIASYQKPEGGFGYRG